MLFLFHSRKMQPLAALSVIRTEKTFRTFRQLDLSCLARDHSARRAREPIVYTD